MTREEALDEIKSWDFLEGKEIEAIHTLVPELSEPEDERIRKIIVKYFEELHEQSWINLEIPDILAYLERQKKQKPVEKLSKEEYVKKFKALCDAYEIKLPNREYDIYGLCEDLHKLFGDIQKSTEWN